MWGLIFPGWAGWTAGLILLADSVWCATGWLAEQEEQRHRDPHDGHGNGEDGTR
jgi:hypothetical protein